MVGYYASASECAYACKGKSTMISYGTNDFGDTNCNNNGCKCNCETSASGGTCSISITKKYKLYKMTSKFVLLPMVF